MNYFAFELSRCRLLCKLVNTSLYLRLLGRYFRCRFSFLPKIFRFSNLVINVESNFSYGSPRPSADTLGYVDQYHSYSYRDVVEISDFFNYSPLHLTLVMNVYLYMFLNQTLPKAVPGSHPNVVQLQEEV